MPHLVPITPETHQNRFWQRYPSYAFSKKNQLAPIVVAELGKAIQSFPMAFVRQQESFLLVCLTSLTPGQNMFVAPDGQWLGSYVPSAFRGYPFQLARADGTDDLILCIDENAGLVSDTSGEPFFDAQGQLSKSVKDIMDFLVQVEQNRSVTQRVVNALADAGLIAEWPLKITAGEKQVPITGLYRVDEARLNSLDDAAFLTLRKKGSLPVAYAQLLSMVNITIFEKLGKIQEQAAPAGTSTANAPDIGVALGDDDLISFQ